MLGQATNLGCDSSNDPACLCSSADFGYGIRDCAIQACPSGTDLGSIIQYGLDYCAAGMSSSTTKHLVKIFMGY